LACIILGHSRTDQVLTFIIVGPLLRSYIRGKDHLRFQQLKKEIYGSYSQAINNAAADGYLTLQLDSTVMELLNFHAPHQNIHLSLSQHDFQTCGASRSLQNHLVPVDCLRGCWYRVNQQLHCCHLHMEQNSTISQSSFSAFTNSLVLYHSCQLRNVTEKSYTQ
jgi:hypothetical protein